MERCVHVGGMHGGGRAREDAPAQYVCMFVRGRGRVEKALLHDMTSVCSCLAGRGVEKAHLHDCVLVGGRGHSRGRACTTRLCVWGKGTREGAPTQHVCVFVWGGRRSRGRTCTTRL
eukprot:359404-Chlamydomonas_euryale.AAC.3